MKQVTFGARQGDRFEICPHVVDFIDVYYASWHWPAFNVADSAISIGAVMLLWSTLRGSGDGR